MAGLATRLTSTLYTCHRSAPSSVVDLGQAGQAIYSSPIRAAFAEAMMSGRCARSVATRRRSYDRESSVVV